jgi:hypothetical protein
MPGVHCGFRVTPSVGLVAEPLGLCQSPGLICVLRWIPKLSTSPKPEGGGVWIHRAGHSANLREVSPGKDSIRQSYSYAVLQAAKGSWQGCR